jgi:hypothetical protein
MRDAAMSMHGEGSGGGWTLRGEDPARLLVALIDLTGPRLLGRISEVLAAAQAASRRGSVVVVAPPELVGEMEAMVAEAVERSGLGSLGLRVVSEQGSRDVLSGHSFVTFVLTDAGGFRVAASGGSTMALLPLDAALEQLRTLGHGPASRQDDPVFARLPRR